MSRGSRPRVEPFGDAAVRIMLGDAVDEVVLARVHRLAAALADGPFGRPVPAWGSLLVPVDPVDPGVAEAVATLGALVEAIDRGPAPAGVAGGDRIDLPTRYGGDDGPDLDGVAAALGLRAQDVVELHASVDYTVAFLGFAPGFAYLGRVPDAISVPRRDTPRTRVPAGSVAIAGRQTAVYPAASPGGWQVIGRTDVRTWDPAAPEPALFVPGRRVRFVPASR